MGTTGRRILIGTAVLVPLAAIGVGGAYAAGLLRPAAPDYRMVEVTSGTVNEVVDLTGSVTRVNQASTTFPTAGTVTDLDVEVGEQVTKGQRLARIERLPLQVELVKAEAELTQARAQYAEDVKAAEEAAKREREAKTQTPQQPNAGNNSAAPNKQKSQGSDQGKPAGGSGGMSPPQSMTLAKAIKELETAVEETSKSCWPLLPTPGTTTMPSPTASPPDSASPSPSPTPSGSPTPSTPPSASPDPSTPAPTQPAPTQSASTKPGDLAICLSNLSAAMVAQQVAFQALSAEQAMLDAQTKALAEAAEAQAKAMAKAAKQQAEALAQAQAELLAQSTGIDETGSGEVGGSAGATKAQLAQDLVAITRAEQAVRKARTDLAGATLRAPITGVVGQIDFTENSVASAASGITIVGSGASEVTVRVPLSLMGKVTAGQPAEVIPPGAVKPVQGKVTSVSLLPNASSPGSYDTVISVPRSPVALTSGVSATVRIEVASATDVPVVPLSATVPIDERQATVQVLGPHGIEERTITTGIKGVSRIEVTKGLTVGQQLVIADPTRPLPSLNIFGTSSGSEEAPSDEPTG